MYIYEQFVLDSPSLTFMEAPLKYIYNRTIRVSL